MEQIKQERTMDDQDKLNVTEVSKQNIAWYIIALDVPICAKRGSPLYVREEV